MDRNARREAQKRIRRIGEFREELAELERERGLTLTAAQRASLDAHLETSLADLTSRFDVDVTRSGRWISWGALVASILGAAAFSAAIILFLHRVWGVVPASVQVTVLVGIPLGLLALTELHARRKGKPFYTALLAGATTVAFVVELSSLVAVLNAVPSVHLLLAGGSFAVLIAYAYSLRLPLAAGLLALCAYPAALLADLEGSFWPLFLERPETVLPAALAVYAVPSFVYRRDRSGFGFVYRICGATSLLLAVLVLSIVGHSSYVRMSIRTIETVYQVAGIALSTGLVVHGIRLGRMGLVNLGALAFVVFLYVKLYAWWWAWMPKYLFFLLVGLIAMLLLYLFRRVRARVAKGGLE